MRCISKFSSWSGQQVNLDKSSLFLSKNTPTAISSSIQDILNLCPISSFTKHLGLPLFFHRNKSLGFEDLKNKFLNRISGWKAKILSQAARNTLIRTVASSLSSYSMSLFFFLKAFARKLTFGLGSFGGEFLLIRSTAFVCLAGKKFVPQRVWEVLALEPWKSRILLFWLSWVGKS